MTLLTKPEIEERVALYQRYGEALDKLSALETAMPFEPPADLIIRWGDLNNDEELEAEIDTQQRSRTLFVVKRAWGALRGAVLADMRAELEAAEAAVRAFENGEQVDERSDENDGAVGSSVAGPDDGQND